MANVILKPKRERSLLRHHPWVFDGAIDRVEGRCSSGDTVNVRSAEGQVLGKGGISTASKIRVRMWHFDADRPVDHALIKNRIQEAINARAGFDAKSGRRLVHAESDGLPGLIVDQYDDCVVLQFGSVVVERWREAIVQSLIDSLQPSCIYERSDSDVRKLEGLEPRVGLIYGSLPTDLSVNENGIVLPVDIVHGHKTGGYVDQRENRAFLQSISAGKTLLNAFCYSGGFSLHALAGGAQRVVSVDSARSALDTAAAALEANPQLDASRAQWVEADVFAYLRQAYEQGDRYDIVILDPPKFAPSAQHVKRASRAYKDINLYASKLLTENGVLISFSCSSGISAELFQKIIAGAALDAKVPLAIVGQLHAPGDHPVALSFPESQYLKGFVLRRTAA